ncbi:replication-relaxation family protein [Bacillus cihuensis]|uniref:replication-relaxation family protein n=1 Tax=Bacillus cihuensis TaxID=1208599 RepID=UPI00048E7E5A|nr:replication-relaxation family protein [Bacillus cihuensis]
MNSKKCVVLDGKTPHKRLELSNREISLLYEIAIHGVVHAQSIHNYLQHFLQKKQHPNTVTNRIRKFVEYGVLIRLQQNVSYTHSVPYRYYYKIGTQGILALVEAELLPEEEYMDLERRLSLLTIPKNHNGALSILAFQSKLRIEENNLPDVEHGRGVYDERLLINAEHGGGILPIVPDWFFRRGKRVLFLEFDSGVQSHQVINSKIDRYIDYAEDKPEEEVVIIFSVMDASVQLVVDNKDRSRRVAALKESMLPVQEWPRNLSIYVLSAERTPKLIYQLLSNQNPLPQSIRKWNTIGWLEELKSSKYFLSLQELNPEMVYGISRTELLEAEFIYRLDHFEHYYDVAFIFGEEGAVSTYQRLRSHHIRTTGQSRYGEKIDRIIVIYSEYEQAEADIYGADWTNVWISDKEVLKRKQPIQKMLRVKSPFKKELSQFE